MWWLWWLHPEWHERAEQARGEAEKSRRSLQETREKIVAPSESLQHCNHFAQLIRDSLLEGKRE